MNSGNEPDEVAASQLVTTADATRAAERTGKVKEYLTAARRKVQIAEYHLKCLRSALTASKRLNELSVPVQAHFEGVLYSVIAVSKQVDQATEHRSMKIFRRKLEAWQQEPIFEDVRLVRNMATHEYYRKTPTGPTLEVQEPRTPYGGPRALDVYSEAACDHLHRLLPLLDEMENVLSASAVEEDMPSRLGDRRGWTGPLRWTNG